MCRQYKEETSVTLSIELTADGRHVLDMSDIYGSSKFEPGFTPILLMTGVWFMQ